MTNQHYNRIGCRACHAEIIPFLSLGKMPLVNSFIKQEEIADEKKYDLTVGFCPRCYLVQLLDIIPPEELFRNYVYFSSTSKSFVEHCGEIGGRLISKLSLGSNSVVLEIASNDGVQLRFFKDRGMRVLGVDPARNIAEAANKNGIPTIAEFFNHKLAKKLKKELEIEADLVFGANVLAHVPEIVDFVKGVEVILKPKGTAVFEFPYLKGLMENKFDIIYHEHVFYYSLMALKNLFRSAGLEIYDVEMTPMQGGSLMIFVSHPNRFALAENLRRLIDQEMRGGFDRIGAYQRIGASINLLKEDLVSLLAKLKSQNKKIIAYGAPAKGNVLLNYFGIGKNYLQFMVDKSPHKQGLRAPGTHLPIYSTDKIYEEKPDYLLVLCWNITEEILEEFDAYRRAGGKFIIPIPKVQII